jgi:AcrR family transcriptional regulator
MDSWEKHRNALEEGWGKELARHSEPPDPDKPLFAEPLEPPAPHSIRGHAEFGVELPIPADASLELIRLRQRQRTVLEMLMIGQNIRTVARLANVSRSTVYNWMKSDAGFKAALKVWQERIQTSARGKLLSATEQAADTVIHKLKEGDLRAALAILKMGGIDGHNPALVQEVSPEPARSAKARAPALEMRLRELLLSMTMPEDADGDRKALPVSETKALPMSRASLPEPVEKLEGQRTVDKCQVEIEKEGASPDLNEA